VNPKAQKQSAAMIIYHKHLVKRVVLCSNSRRIITKRITTTTIPLSIVAALREKTNADSEGILKFSILVPRFWLSLAFKNVFEELTSLSIPASEVEGCSF
jgi:hypothetical protein